MMLAAAKAVASEVSEQGLGTGSLYPRIARLREVSQRVAHDVALAAIDGGVVPEEFAESFDRENLAERIERESWTPDYVPYRAV
jgi:malic enzyme